MPAISIATLWPRSKLTFHYERSTLWPAFGTVPLARFVNLDQEWSPAVLVAEQTILLPTSPQW